MKFLSLIRLAAPARGGAYMRVTFFNKKGRLLYSFRLCHILPGIAIFYNSELVIPYGMSDITSGIATVGVSELIDCMCAVA